MFHRTAAVVALVALVALVAGCASNIDVSDIAELDEVAVSDVEARLADSEVPVVLNVWASWCVPCRSEAPLLNQAAEQFAGQVEVIGLDVRDDQTGARRFIAEFLADAPMEHLFDRSGDIPVQLGGSRAVPLTFFYAPGGELIDLHTGVLDEATLALGIDELLARVAAQGES